jgi:hypothetical protein
MQIRLDDLTGSEVIALLEEHLQNMHQWSPPESVHALDLGKLRSPDITFWTAWQDGMLMGCGALKEIDERRDQVDADAQLAPSQRGGPSDPDAHHPGSGTARLRDVELGDGHAARFRAGSNFVQECRIPLLRTVRLV